LRETKIQENERVMEIKSGLCQRRGDDRMGE
jgi:hypothetical protein